MKKYLFFAIAAAAVVFAGCENKGNEPKDEKSLTIQHKTRELAIGDELVVDVVKKGTFTVTYKSSDESVATVTSFGAVTGVAKGEAQIFVDGGEESLRDTCTILVKEESEIFTVGGWTIWNLDKTDILSKDTVLVTLSDGTEVHCVTCWASYHIWDNNCTLTGNTISGKGQIIIADVPVYLITDTLDGKEPNYWYVGARSLTFVDPDKFDLYSSECAYCASACKIVGTAEDYYAWLTDTTGTVPNAIKGMDNSYILLIDYDNQEIVAHFTGFPGEGVYTGGETEAYYQTTLNWFEDGNLDTFGFALNEDKSDWKDPLEWARVFDIYYERLEEEEPEEVYTKQEWVAPANYFDINTRTIKSTTNMYKK